MTTITLLNYATATLLLIGSMICYSGYVEGREADFIIGIIFCLSGRL